MSADAVPLRPTRRCYYRCCCYYLIVVAVATVASAKPQNRTKTTTAAYGAGVASSLKDGTAAATVAVDAITARPMTFEGGETATATADDTMYLIDEAVAWNSTAVAAGDYAYAEYDSSTDVQVPLAFHNLHEAAKPDIHFRVDHTTEVSINASKQTVPVTVTSPTSEQPVSVTIASTTSEQPVSVAIASTTSKQPVSVAIASTTSEQPIFVAIASTTSEQPVSVAIASTISEQPATISTTSEKPVTISTTSEKPVTISTTDSGVIMQIASPPIVYAARPNINFPVIITTPVPSPSLPSSAYVSFPSKSLLTLMAAITVASSIFA